MVGTSSPGRAITVGLIRSIGARGVVATEAGRTALAEPARRGEERGVRALGDEHDRMVAVTHELGVVVPDGGVLGALVLGVGVGVRPVGHRLLDRDRAEVELGHLPVALVDVVPLVVDVEEPVLGDEVAVLRGHPPVDRRRRPERVEPLLVVAAGVEGVARQVDPPVLGAAGEVRCGGGGDEHLAVRRRAARRRRARGSCRRRRGGTARRRRTARSGGARRAPGSSAPGGPARRRSAGRRGRARSTAAPRTSPRRRR